MSDRRVVVTGLGATTPLGGDVATTWPALLAGTSGVRLLTEDWAQTLPVHFAARVAVEPSEQMERVEMRRLDRSEQFAVIASREAWKDAGSPDIDKELRRCHCIWHWWRYNNARPIRHFARKRRTSCKSTHSSDVDA